MEVSLGGVWWGADLQVTLTWSYFALWKPTSGGGSNIQAVSEREDHLIPAT